MHNHVPASDVQTQLQTHVSSHAFQTHTHGDLENSMPRVWLSPALTHRHALRTLTPTLLSTPYMCTQTAGWLCTQPGRGPGDREPGPKGCGETALGPCICLRTSLSLDFPHLQVLLWGEVSGFGEPELRGHGHQGMERAEAPRGEESLRSGDS